MKAALVCIFSFISFFQVSTTDLSKSFQQASLSAEQAQAFYEKVLTIKTTDESASLYKGAALVTLAKFEKKIKVKKELVKEGALLIEAAIEREPTNVEFRLVRLIIQENTPKIVGYYKNIDSDKKLIIKQYDQQSTAVKKWIKTYAEQSKAFTAEERNKLL
ncbi:MULTISPECIES: hypothetical protein [unclassified Myroides]|uniref:hypothetical protein n=1 Tax=unclassified Myroides TaxID=2642485 RepID=UPI0015FE494B|nr:MULTISPECIES: hypothetical protein [unclassified Myroides]MBB1149264.1 hypothetical protein [Myroides sp. NP-2]MDM1406905.1 hypothetical protein [Myroides sp. DF42-4-2]